MFSSIKHHVRDIILSECDDLIIDILKEKLDISVTREKDNIVFVVKFGGVLVKQDSVSVK